MRLSPLVRISSSKNTADSTPYADPSMVQSGSFTGVSLNPSPSTAAIALSFIAFSSGSRTSSKAACKIPTRIFFRSALAFQLNGISDTLRSRPSGRAITLITTAQSSA
jgi:hypothetical protein